MKNLLLLLLLANILYFLWGVYQEDSSETGVAIIDEAALGPPLQVETSRQSDGTGGTGAALGSGRSSELEAIAGRSCVTVGPFTVGTDADSAALLYSSEGMKSRVRTTQGRIFVGHWVQIRDIADEATAKAMLDKLGKGGLADAYLVRTEDEGLKISLGLFGDIEGAEKIELQARSLELPADISPRMADRTVYFVDVALPPGRGAGAIVERYGEEQVLLRELATCPQ
ncbi:MAG: SPOR domain-containing protein [Gammaproteobacteria bacterium]|nr:SPOR domain-containing protein [Gammaproteobacteria bacterium]MDH3362852.1 SPOR domain-containing protein [Gammaproteobacteria bacterium]